MVRAALALLVALLVLPAGAEAAVRERTLLDLPNESEFSYHAGLGVVSAYDEGSREYHLVLVRDGAGPQRLPIAASDVPFDADLGPDGAGRPAVVYSRCAPGGTREAEGCDRDLYLHRLGAAGERPISSANAPGADDEQPTLWRGEVAWVRTYRDLRQVVYARPLRRARTRPSDRQPGLPTRNCALRSERGDCTTGDRRIADLELRGRLLALSGRYVVDDQDGFDTREIRLIDRLRGTVRRVALLTSGEGGQAYVGLSFSGGHLGWHRSCFGDPSGCGGRGAFRYDLARDRYEHEEDYRPLSGFALDGDDVIGVDGGGELGDEPGTQFGSPCPAARGALPACPVVRLGPLAWRAIAARRVR